MHIHKMGHANNPREASRARMSLSSSDQWESEPEGRIRQDHSVKRRLDSKSPDAQGNDFSNKISHDFTARCNVDTVPQRHLYVWQYSTMLYGVVFAFYSRKVQFYACTNIHMRYIGLLISLFL